MRGAPWLLLLWALEYSTGDSLIDSLQRCDSNTSSTCGVLTDVEWMELRAAAQLAAGIYSNPKQLDDQARRSGDLDLRKTVLLTSLNSGYFDVYQNWVCHVERLNLKYMVWAQESAAAVTITAFLLKAEHRRAGTLFFSKTMSEHMPVGTAASRFGHKSFQKISSFKLLATHALMHAGYNVWLSDSDIAFIRDPWPWFRHDSLCDYVFQPNGEDWKHGVLSKQDYQQKGKVGNHEGNTGFQLLRAGDRNKQAVVDAIGSAQSLGMDDQAGLWISWSNRKDLSVVSLKMKDALTRDQAAAVRASHQFRVCPLPAGHFPSGKHGPLKDNKAKNRAVIFHPNFVMGTAKKVELLKDSALWMRDGPANSNDYKCKPLSRAFGVLDPAKSNPYGR